MLRQKLATLRKSQTCGVERERGKVANAELELLQKGGCACGSGEGSEGNVEQVIQFNENFIDVGPNQ